MGNGFDTSIRHNASLLRNDTYMHAVRAILTEREGWIVVCCDGVCTPERLLFDCAFGANRFLTATHHRSLTPVGT